MKPKYLGKQNLSKNLTLDKISREESRKDYNKFKSYGVDIWNAYEFSYLLNGKPKLIVLEINHDPGFKPYIGLESINIESGMSNNGGGQNFSQNE